MADACTASSGIIGHDGVFYGRRCSLAKNHEGACDLSVYVPDRETYEREAANWRREYEESKRAPRQYRPWCDP